MWDMSVGFVQPKCKEILVEAKLFVGLDVFAGFV